MNLSNSVLADLDKHNPVDQNNRLSKFLDDLGDINQQDNAGFSVLHLFMYRGWSAGVRLILDRPEARLDLQTKKGRTALHWACGNSSICVKMLCQDSRMSLDIINIKDIDGITALEDARRKEKKNVVKLIEQFKLGKKSKSSSNISSLKEELLALKEELAELTQAIPSSSEQESESEYIESDSDSYSESEPKAKKLKTENNAVLVSLFEELVSMNRIVKDSQTSIEGKEAEGQSKLQELIDSQKVMRKGIASDHQKALDKLLAEQKRLTEDFENRFSSEREELLRQVEQDLKPLREEFDTSQRLLGEIKKRLRVTLQEEEEAQAVPSCPGCDLSLEGKMIYSCLEGHSVCGDCRKRYTKCRECPDDGSGYPARNRFMEVQIGRMLGL